MRWAKYQKFEKIEDISKNTVYHGIPVYVYSPDGKVCIEYPEYIDAFRTNKKLLGRNPGRTFLYNMLVNGFTRYTFKSGCYIEFDTSAILK